MESKWRRPVLDYQEPRAIVRWWWRFFWSPFAPLHWIAAASVLLVLIILVLVVWLLITAV